MCHKEGPCLPSGQGHTDTKTAVEPAVAMERRKGRVRALQCCVLAAGVAAKGEEMD